MTEVDICIISYAKTEELKKITERGIYSVLSSDPDINFNILVVEGNEKVSYSHIRNTKTIYPMGEFGYNKYLNIAIRNGKSPYVFLANNDLTYEKGWCTTILHEMHKDQRIMSASPFCPQTQNSVLKKYNSIYGYTVRQQLAGWAIFCKRELFSIIGGLDEGVDFWFSDNIYADQLQHKKISHALITNSVVNHHENNLGVTGMSILDQEKMNEYTTGQYTKYLEAKVKYL